MHDDEPGVLAVSPLPPRLGHRLQVGPVRQSQLDGPRPEGGQAPLRPGLRLPGPVGGRGIAPGGGRGARVGETRRPGPGQQSAPGVGLASVGPGGGHVDRAPLLHTRGLGEPGHGGVDGVAHGHDPAGAGDAAHLGQGTHRVREVLKDLVGVDDVEGGVLEGQGHDVPAGQLHLLGQTPFAKRRPSRLQGTGRGVQGDDPPRGDAFSEIRGDGRRPAADVEQIHSRAQVGKQVGGRVRRAAPRVRAEHRRTVTVGVAGCLDGTVWKLFTTHASRSSRNVICVAQTSGMRPLRRLCFLRIARCFVSVNVSVEVFSRRRGDQPGAELIPLGEGVPHAGRCRKGL